MKDVNFDKRQIFKDLIEPSLEDIRRKCNRYDIPFVWVAAVYNDEKETKYAAVVDPNDANKAGDETADNDDGLGGYLGNTITPGSLEMRLHDDKIKDIIKVMNGFQVIAKDNTIGLDKDMNDVESGMNSGINELKNTDVMGLIDFSTDEDDETF